MKTSVNKEKNWDNLSYEEKNAQLYIRQKLLLQEFLEKGAISKVQYDLSLKELEQKFQYKTSS